MISYFAINIYFTLIKKSLQCNEINEAHMTKKLGFDRARYLKGS